MTFEGSHSRKYTVGGNGIPRLEQINSNEVHMQTGDNKIIKVAIIVSVGSLCIISVVLVFAIVYELSTPDLPFTSPTNTITPSLTLSPAPTQTAKPPATLSPTPSPTFTPILLSWDDPCKAYIYQWVILTGVFFEGGNVLVDEEGYKQLLIKNPSPECEDITPKGIICYVDLAVHPAQLDPIPPFYQKKDIRLHLEGGGEARIGSLIVFEGIMTRPYGAGVCGIRLEKAYLP